MFILCRYTVLVTTSWNTRGTVYGTSDKSYSNDLYQIDHTSHYSRLRYFRFEDGREKCKSDGWVNRLNRRLRKIHIPLGLALLIAAFVHAIFSSTGIFALIWGALCLVFLALTCLTWFFRKRKGFNFMKWHRVLTVAFLITLVLHLAEVPALKAKNSSEIRGGESYSQTQLNE